MAALADPLSPGPSPARGEGSTPRILSAKPPPLAALGGRARFTGHPLVPWGLTPLPISHKSVEVFFVGSSVLNTCVYKLKCL